ncbi:MAG: SDR family oxidoreductase [Pseudomonadota bacterium]
MGDRLSDRVVVVTGGAGAIGKAVARRFLKEGAQLLLVDHDEAALAAAANELDSGAIATFAADVTRSEDNQAMFAAAIERFGGVDVFLANAGIEGRVAPLTDYDEDEFERVLAVNVKGVFLGIKHAVPVLANRGGGSIVITSSVAGLQGTAGVGAYTTSKHAVIGLMRTAALEAAPHKVRVNTVNPAPVYGRMMESLEAGLTPGDATATRSALESRIPLGRYAEADDIASIMLFLASDDARYVTGSVYVSDGGLTA